MGIEAPSKEDAVLSPGLSTQPTSSKCWSAFVLSSLASFNTGSVPHTRGTESGNKLEVISPVHRIQGFFFFQVIYQCSFFILKKYLFIYFWLGWVFIAVQTFLWSQGAGATPQLQCVGFSLRWLLSLQSTCSRYTDFCGCNSWALEHRLSSCGAQA